MEYRKVNITAFEGLDANSRPELIKDTQASDIENLRFEKLGYLINRNGVQMRRLLMERTVFSDIKADLYPIGAVGIGEFVLEKPFGSESTTDGIPPYDGANLDTLTPVSQSDRFMVYAFRIPTNELGEAMTDSYNEPNHSGTGFNPLTWRYKMAYVLSPELGADDWRDTFFFAPNGTVNIGGDPDSSTSSLYATVGARTILRPDGQPSSIQTYAPARWLSQHNDAMVESGQLKDLNWIDHYVVMKQYRRSLVISDMTNGDLLLADTAHEAEFSEDLKHNFELRENAIIEFDVDDVVIDFGLDTGGFNDGVKAPIVLHRYFLPKRRLTATRDNFEAYYTAAPDKSPTWEKAHLSNNPYGSVGNAVIYRWWMPDNDFSFVMTELGSDTNSDTWSTSGIAFNTVKQFAFTMNENGDEVDDLLGKLTYTDPNIETKDPTTGEDLAARSIDPYRWDDFELTYFPASGKTQGEFFLRGIDRDWDKISAGGTKAVKLTTKSGAEQEVPLGVWRYRFVWYAGAGEYSAASTELLVPDILFSGLKDADIVASVGSYQRPTGIDSEDDALRTSLPIGETMTQYFFNQTADASTIRISDGTALTEYGELFVRLKEALFNPDHKFGALHSSTSGASWPADWSTESMLALGQVQVTTTLYFADDVATCKGHVGETAFQKYDDAEDYDLGDYSDVEFSSYQSSAVSLMVPLFAPQSAVATESYLFNSAFTSYGVPRMLWQNKAANAVVTGYDAAIPAYQIIFEGKTRFGVDEASTEWLPNFVSEKGASIYFNVVPIQVSEELNNADDDELLVTPPAYRYEFRNMSVLRGVRDHRERLSVTKSGLPAEVLTRVILTGTGEISLCEYGDMGTWETQKQRVPTNDRDNLGRTVDRSYKFVDALEYFTHTLGGTWRAPIYIRGAEDVNGRPQFRFTNVKVAISGRGERLTIPEQITSYTPASVAFDAPRVKLTIPADRVPKRAKQLLIFRTLASHDNDWIPTQYGLVEAIDIMRDDNNELTGEHATSIEFLDDVKSDKLDFSYDLEAYEGFVQPIRSRFCLPLNERVYYANLVETYRPRKPRNAVEINPYDEGEPVPDPLNIPHRNLNYPPTTPEMVRLWTHRVVEDTAASTNIDPAATHLYYFLSYQDAARTFSLAAYSGAIDRTAGSTIVADKGRVVLVCAPSQYGPMVDEGVVYRLATTTPLTEVRLEGLAQLPATNGKVYLVVQGAVEYQGRVYYPKDVIRTASMPDSGVPTAIVDAFVNSFTGALTHRGHHGSHGDPLLLDITDHLEGGAGPFIERIGVIKPEDEGVYYDDDGETKGRLSLRALIPLEERLESGLRWSDPYTPNKLSLASLAEVRAGDGDQITGLEALYGNLIVFKERSMHRLAVQAVDPPVSRVDEISNVIGCIAPNTVISINSAVYFLSWSGFYRYDNNKMEKMDGAFAEELQQRLRSTADGQPNPSIRDASCAWNPSYRELYLNIPIMGLPTGSPLDEEDMASFLYDNKGLRVIRGVIYAISLDNGMVTKYRYMDDSVYFTDVAHETLPTPTTVRAPRTQGRLYFNNSLGHLRSAEILPGRTKDYISADTPTALNYSRFFLHSGIFIESPTRVSSVFEKPDDDFFYYNADIAGLHGTRVEVGQKLIRTFWRSKHWTADDKSVIKRVRKVFAYMGAASQPTVIRGRTHTSPEGNTATTDIEWSHTYGLTLDPTVGVEGELLAEPTNNAGAATSPSQSRGERYIFEVESGGRVQMEYFGFYWKPINTYER